MSLREKINEVLKEWQMPIMYRTPALDAILAAISSEPAAGELVAWTGNADADAALVMLDRIDVGADDDMRVDSITATIRKFAATIADLQARLEAAEKDAARYRLLRRGQSLD